MDGTLSPFNTSSTRNSINAIRELSLGGSRNPTAVPLAEEGAVKLACRTTELLLVFTNEFQQARTLETLSERSAVPMVLIKNNLSLGHYFLDHYFFTHPSKKRDEVILLGTRPKGELTFVGRIQILKNELTFKLNSVDSRYAPAIEVEGRYHPDKRSWEFTRALTSTRIAAKKNVARTPRRASPSFR